MLIVFKELSRGQKITPALFRPLSRLFSSNSATFNYYEELGVTRKSNKKEIKAQYKTLVKKYHPDIYKGKDDSRFQRIQDAYRTLVSPKKRAVYDRELDGKNSMGGVGGGSDSGVNWQDISDQYKEKSSAQDFYADFNTVGSKEKIKISEEYEKFRKTQNSTNFGDLNVREDSMTRKMNEQDRKREIFIHKNNMSKTEKVISHRFNETTYEENIQEEIDRRNTVYQEDTNPILRETIRQKILKQLTYEVYMKLSVFIIGCIFAIFYFRAQRNDGKKMEIIMKIQRDYEELDRAKNMESRMSFQSDQEFEEDQF